jgi:hypothetical protein
MSNHRTDRTIDTIIGLAEGLTTKLPAARDHLLREIRLLDGFTGGSDAPKVKATSELTGVERAASQRIHHQQRMDALNDEINAVVQILSNLHKDCDRINATRIEVPRCSSTGREGAIEWADATCWDAPARGSLCAKCYQRERRWRQRNGLPTRDVA